MYSDDTQFVLLIGSMVVSGITWIATSRKYPGTKADLVRLAITAALTAGFFWHGINVVYWTLLFDDSMWPAAIILMPIYWFGYVVIYYFALGALAWVKEAKRERQAALQRMRERDRGENRGN